MRFLEEPYPVIKQNDTRDQPLNKKTEARPAAGERRKESLQEMPLQGKLQQVEQHENL